MAICASGEKLFEEATDIHRRQVYPVAKNIVESTVKPYSTSNVGLVVSGDFRVPGEWSPCFWLSPRCRYLPAFVE